MARTADDRGYWLLDRSGRLAACGNVSVVWEINVRIAVVDLKGGVGETTTAVHLVGGLAQRAPDVLVDSDAQGRRPKRSA